MHDLIFSLVDILLIVVIRRICLQMQRSNPSEEKYKTLSVSRIIDDDPTLKPSRAEKDRLAGWSNSLLSSRISIHEGGVLEILQLPPTAVLRKEDIALVWQFRYFLSEDPNSLSKFLRAVQWEHVSMRAQVILNDHLEFWCSFGLLTHGCTYSDDAL